MDESQERSDKNPYEMFVFIYGSGSTFREPMTILIPVLNHPTTQSCNASILAISSESPACDFLYRRMASEARGDLFVKATCLENSDQSLTLFLTE